MSEKPVPGEYKPGVYDAQRHRRLLDRLRARHESPETAEYAEFAKGLAIEAGEIIRRYFKEGAETQWKDDNTPLTKADEEVNQLVLEKIAQKYPNHSIVGEESSRETGSDFTWICDPIDGTTGFSMGIPTFVFSLSLLWKGKVVMGLLYDPIKNSVLLNEKGKGTMKNGAATRTLPVDTLERTRVNWSEPGRLPSLQNLLAEKGSNVLSLFSAQYSAFLVATGKMAASIYAGKHIWDIAAVDAVVSGAGGKVTDLDGNPLNYTRPLKGCLASCGGPIHTELIALIAEAKGKDKGLKTPNQLSHAIGALNLKQRYFETIVEGRFKPDDIDVVFSEPGGSIRRSRESEAFIEKEWQRRIAAGLNWRESDGKPSRYRFVGAEVVNGRLRITLDPSVSYRDAIGSRPAEFEKKFGTEYMPNPVAVTTVIRAKNKAGQEMLLMTLRSKTHDIKPGGYHISLGGLMEIKKDKNPTDTAMREVKEETGIDAQPEDLTCLGVFKHGIGSSTEIIYEAKTDVSVEDILKLHHDDENKVVAIPATASALREWIVVPTHANVGITNIVAILVGQDIIRNTPEHEGGGEKAAKDWERIMLAFLAGRSEQLKRGRGTVLEKRDVERLQKKVKGL